MKTMTLLLVFLSCVGYSHTDEEKSRYVNGILEGALYVASDDNWSVEGRDPDPDNVLSTWEGFLGRPGGDSWVSGWSLAERRSAFDWYLATLATTNCLAFSSMDKRKVLLAFARCKRLCYTNAVPFLRGAALNPNCVHRDFAIEFSLELGRVDVPTTRFVETIMTNLSAFTRVERGIACGVYADKILNSSPWKATDVEVRNDALRSLYRNRMVDVAGVNMLDTRKRGVTWMPSSRELQTWRAMTTGLPRGAIPIRTMSWSRGRGSSAVVFPKTKLGVYPLPKIW